MKVRLTARICGWIVRRAMLDPRTQRFIVDEVLDAEQFDSAAVDAVLDSNELERMMVNQIDQAMEDHCNDRDHVSENDLEEKIESMDLSEVMGFDEEVERVVTGMNDEHAVEAVRRAIASGQLREVA